MSAMDDVKWWIEVTDLHGNIQYINITKAEGYSHACQVFESAEGRSVVLCRADGTFIAQRIEET